MNDVASRDEVLRLAGIASRTLEPYLPLCDSSELLRSIRNQVAYIADNMTTRRWHPAPEAAARINLGLLAVRELESTVPELARALLDLDYAFKQWALAGDDRPRSLDGTLDSLGIRGTAAIDPPGSFRTR